MCLCHYLERRAIPESVEIFGKQAAATRVGLGKEVSHGSFDNSALQFWSLGLT